ncbi:unnamed protein product [Nippostrongylus brasiliensis]|uniref:Sigma 1-type opioid receptor n=1 Tax=Nippostrongylus brasiliensis TaxID=27835 RepID=A0A0N4XLR5_NIPBR|nr:unnamed protein product [Nippostrongylus brasiliensis]
MKYLALVSKGIFRNEELYPRSIEYPGTVQLDGQQYSGGPVTVALPLGGLPLRALFLHTYFTEFIGVIGTPYAATGRLGMHWSNSTCTVLMGSVSRLPEDGQIPRKESFSMG